MCDVRNKWETRNEDAVDDGKHDGEAEGYNVGAGRAKLESWVVCVCFVSSRNETTKHEERGIPVCWWLQNMTTIHAPFYVRVSEWVYGTTTKKTPGDGCDV